MDYISSAVSVLETALFWGMMVIVSLMFLTLLSIVGVGLTLVYFTNKLFLIVTNSESDQYKSFTTTHQDQNLEVWFKVNADGSFGGLQYVEDLDDSRTEELKLSDDEMEKLSDEANAYSEAHRDQP